MYKISNDLEELKLNKITPRALKVLKELGLLNFDPNDVNIVDKTIDVFTDCDKLQKLIFAIFVIDKKEINVDEIDLGKVTEAYRDFLSQLTMNTNG